MLINKAAVKMSLEKGMNECWLLIVQWQTINKQKKGGGLLHKIAFDAFRLSADTRNTI